MITRNCLLNGLKFCQFPILLSAFFVVTLAAPNPVSPHKTVSKKTSAAAPTSSAVANGDQLKPLAPETVSVASAQPGKPSSGQTTSVADSMQPFLKTINFDIPPGTTQGNIPITIPEGKRLVIEYISVRAQGPTGQKFISQIQTNVAHTESLRGKIYVVLFYQGNFSGIDIFTASQPMHVYAEPSVPPALFVTTRTDISGTAFVEATISGYIVTMHR